MDLQSRDLQILDPKTSREGSEAEENLPRALNLLLMEAMNAIKDPAHRANVLLADIDNSCKSFATNLAEKYAVTPARVSFDRQTNIYLVTELYQTGGHRTLLRQLIAARPRERHVVLFTGTFENSRDFGLSEVVEAGGFPIYPDRTLGLFDRLLWLREKLASFMAQRLFTLHHPEDVLAAIALSDFDRPSTYVVHHADTTASVGVDLAKAKHLAIRPEQQKRIQGIWPDRDVYAFPLSFHPESVKLRNQTLAAKVLSKSKTAARALLRRPRVFPRKGALITATCGGGHKFEIDGPLGLPATIIGILRATGGQHVHIGPTGEALQNALEQALADANIPPENLSIVGEVTSVAQALDSNAVDVFVSSFPVGGGLTIVEAAFLGIPVAVFSGDADDVTHYLSGATHAPADALIWKTPDELECALRALMSETPDASATGYAAKSALGKATQDRLKQMAASSRIWFETKGSSKKFGNRLNAIICHCEGRHRAPLNVSRDDIAKTLVNPKYYLARYPDVAAAGLDPVQHYLSTGEKKLNSPNALFDPAYYLSNLSELERKSAQSAPLTHYVLRGEAQGYKPHPLFDPAFCKASIEATGVPAQGKNPKLSGNILAQYLRRDDQVAPHMFFDPGYYVRQLHLPVRGQSLLVHFLENGVAKGTCPHPMLHPALLEETPEQRHNAVLKFLTSQELSRDQVNASRLFDASHFCEDSDLERYLLVAPNLLWAYLIEGNRIGRDPHILISVEHVIRLRPDTLRSAETIAKLVAVDKLNADTHPLIQRSYILDQAASLANIHESILEFFLKNGGGSGIEPHPYFSTQFYVAQNPDIRSSEINPLVHYLTFGQFEGRIPHPMFAGNETFEEPRETDSNDSPLLWLLAKGTPLFYSISFGTHDEGDLSKEMAIRLFRLGLERESASLLYRALHSETGGDHPTLSTEVCSFSIDSSDASETVEIYPQETVTVSRPSVASHAYIAPTNGQYEVPAGTASVYTHATIVPGNDGFLTESGTWVDHGLVNFDEKTMHVKGFGAVVAVEQDKVLLRRYTSKEVIAAGILASGTYSHNYFHFILEVVSRVMLASDIAPAHVPILADDEMPYQHYQALRYFFPDREVLRLSRHVSVSVGKLYVGSMANVVHDEFDHDTPKFDTIRYHPRMIERLSRFGLSTGNPQGEKRLLLKRQSRIRNLVNYQKISSALVDRGFREHNCAHLNFSEQLQMFAGASDVVGQSGAHFANMLFASKGTRIFTLFSNTPGTNFYFWSTLGECLGLDVVNIVGWRLKGSAKAGLQAVHENFNVPEALVTPFFSKDISEKLEDYSSMPASDLLDELVEANTQADAFTGSWGLLSKPTPLGFNEGLIGVRRQMMARLKTIPQTEIETLLEHDFFKGFRANIRSGLLVLTDYSTDEHETIKNIFAYFKHMSHLKTGDLASADQINNFARMLAMAMIYVPAWKLPLIADLDNIDAPLRSLYLEWVTATTYPYLEGDDEIYVAYTVQLLDWLAIHLEESRPVEQREMIAKLASRLDLGQLFVIDQPIQDVLLARNRLLKYLAVDDGTVPRQSVRPMDQSQGRIRIGVLCRTFAKGPDSEAIVAFFRKFDQSKYEIFAYSVNFRDRVVTSDDDFDRLFDSVIDHRREFSSNAYGMRERLLADELDVFLYANATTFGVGEPELALYHRVAPVQMTLNSHVPMAPGFDSFDYFLTGQSDDPAVEISDTSSPERILRVQGPVINYINSLTPKASNNISRATLGLVEDDIVMINAGACQKIRREFLLTMMQALKRVPKGKLLLAPYNPGWAGRSQAFAFNIQVAEAAKATGVSLDRILILSEMSVAEAETVLSLSDIYLSSFPHGGATMTHLSLIYGVPPVVMRRRSTRSIDQFLVGSLGFEQLLANSQDEYVDLVASLAENKSARLKLADDIKNAAKHPVFVASADYSKSMEKTLLTCLKENELKRDQ